MSNKAKNILTFIFLFIWGIVLGGKGEHVVLTSLVSAGFITALVADARAKNH